MLKPGDRAPQFRLPSTHGHDIALTDFAGQKVLLYFYPKDDTPGCTQEACDFRDHHTDLSDAGVVVLGVSKDSLASHERFQAKHSLPFTLLSDSDNDVATNYGAYGEKNMYGRKVMGTIRSTFLIDEQGNIEQVWSPVRVKGHVDAVRSALGMGDGDVELSPPASRKAAKAPSRKTNNPARKTAGAYKRRTKKKVTKKKAGKKKARKKVAKKKVSKKRATQKKVAKKKATKKKASRAASKKAVRKKKTASKTTTRKKKATNTRAKKRR